MERVTPCQFYAANPMRRTAIATIRGRSASPLSSLPKRKADFIEPMDCSPVTKLIDGHDWIYEIKLDGYRAVAVKSDGRVSLFSRRRKSFDHHYPLIVEALAELPEGTVVTVRSWLSTNQADRTSICSKISAAKHPVFTISSSTFSSATTAILPSCRWSSAAS